jgi:hypothetical protein
VLALVHDQVLQLHLYADLAALLGLQAFSSIAVGARDGDRITSVVGIPPACSGSPYAFGLTQISLMRRAG